MAIVDRLMPVIYFVYFVTTCGASQGKFHLLTEAESFLISWHPLSTGRFLFSSLHTHLFIYIYGAQLFSTNTFSTNTLCPNTSSLITLQLLDWS